jgi:hypothetical protein
MIYHLLDADGLYVGASTALNVVAAKELAVKLGKGSRVVTILCDGAYRCAFFTFYSSLLLHRSLSPSALRLSVPQHRRVILIPSFPSLPSSKTATNPASSPRRGSSRRSSTKSSPNTSKSTSSCPKQANDLPFFPSFLFFVPFCRHRSFFSHSHGMHCIIHRLASSRERQRGWSSRTERR